MTLLEDIEIENIVSSITEEGGRIAKSNANEHLIILQIRRLADGLLAHMIVGGVRIDNNIWLQHYLSYIDDFEKPNYQSENLESSVREFKTVFIERIIKKQIKIISPANLKNIEIKFSDASFLFYEEILINEYLVELGSDLKLFIVNHVLTQKSKIKKYFNKEEEILVDHRFILGRTSSISVLWTARFFDFKEEYAISPYLNILIQGMHDFNRIVIRQSVIKYFINNELADESCHIEHDHNKIVIDIYDIRYKSVIAHELGHIEHDHNKIGSESFVLTWHYNIRYDIFNFIKQKRSIQDIKNEFNLAFDNSFLRVLGKRRVPESLLNEIEEIKIEKILNDFLMDGVAYIDDNGYYHCKSIYF